MHVLMAATLRGHVVRGPMVDGEPGVRRRPRLAGPRTRAVAGRRGAGPAGPSLPGGARPGRRRRPRPVGRDTARSGPARAGRPRRRADVVRRWARRPDRARARPRAPAAPAAGVLRAAAAGLGVAGRGRRGAPRAGDRQRAVPAVRPRRRPRGGDLGAARRHPDDPVPGERCGRGSSTCSSGTPRTCCTSSACRPGRPPCSADRPGSARFRQHRMCRRACQGPRQVSDAGQPAVSGARAPAAAAAAARPGPRSTSARCGRSARRPARRPR